MAEKDRPLIDERPTLPARIGLTVAILDRTSDHFDGVDLNQLTETRRQVGQYGLRKNKTREYGGNKITVYTALSGGFKVAEYSVRTSPEDTIVEERSTLYGAVGSREQRKLTSISVINDADNTVDIRLDGQDLNTIEPDKRRKAAEVFDLPLHLGVRTDTLPIPTSAPRIIWDK